MNYTEKGTIEDFIIQEAQKLGWEYVEPKEIKSRRKEEFEEPLIAEDLEIALLRINKDIEFTNADVSYVLTSLKTLPSNIEGIKKFLDIFRNGLVVPLQKEKKEKVVKLFDLENIEQNEFIVTNQFRLEGPQGSIRADVIFFVNGIPLVLIEGKNPTIERVDWTDAYRQIKRYEEEVPELFKYVQFSIATDGIKTYYFPNAFKEENKDFLSIWEDPYPFKREEFRGDTLKITIYGLLSKPNLMDLIENFTFIRKERDKVAKIMGRYMQFRASNEIFQRVVDTLMRRDDKKRGLIWHWQGSGKTYTMAFSAWKLFHCPQAQNPTIFVLVDRRELEKQIEEDFSFIGVPIEKVGSIKELIEILRWGKEGKRGIFLATIEKFSPKEFKELKEQGERPKIKRENVVVLADEVHRTHYGKFSTLMRSVFEDAFIFGFTGTPLSKEDRDTFQKFCPQGELYLDRYSMLDSIKDGFTVPISYQARLPEYQLKREQLRDFIKFEEEEVREDLTPEEQKELKRKVRIINAFIKKPERVEAIAQDIAEHFKEVVELTGLKALVVTIDREACVLYKNALDRFLPESYSEIVMTLSLDDEEIIRNYYRKLQEKYKSGDLQIIHREILDRFKAKEDPKVLIVTDMLITGFDAPALWVMYLDKPLKEHRALQAIARTNRPFMNKKYGLIYDYIGILKELEDAFMRYEAYDASALRSVIRDLSVESKTFESLMADTLKIFESVKKDDTAESLKSALEIFELDIERAKKFEELMKELMKSYEMLKGEPFLWEYMRDYTWLSKIYVAYNKKFKKAGINELKLSQLSKKTMHLIQQTIDIKEIEDAFPLISISEEYIEAIKKSAVKTPGAAIDILTNARREVLLNPYSPFLINLSREIEETYEDLRARRIKTEEAIQKALDISEKIVKRRREEEEIGRDKYPLYEVIKSLFPEIERQKVIELVDGLLAHLKKVLFKGWQLQREVRRRAKAETRIFLLSRLKDYKDKIDELTDKIFELLIRWI